MSNIYWKNAVDFKNKLSEIVKSIFFSYGNKLIFKMEDINLIADKNNCISSSTAIGFAIEEFISSKLQIYTNIDQNSEFKIHRIDRTSRGNSTPNLSYDVFSFFQGEKFLINIKADKGGNNAISAINKLINDYANNPNEIKHFLIFKIKYETNDNETNDNNKIIVNGFDFFYLEEIDFSKGHKQDHRNWSSDYNPLSGRLQISKKWLNDNLLDESKISYKNTLEMLNNIKQRYK